MKCPEWGFIVDEKKSRGYSNSTSPETTKAKSEKIDLAHNGGCSNCHHRSMRKLCPSGHSSARWMLSRDTARSEVATAVQDGIAYHS